jgi:hypothetical protein
MDILNIQSLVANGLITDVASIDPNKAYVAVGVFQPGNRPSGSGNNTYPSYAMPISEFLAAGGIYTGSNGIALVGNDFQLASLLVSQFTNDANYVAGTGIIGFIPRWDLTDTLGNSIIFDDGLGKVGIGTITPTAKLDVNGQIVSGLGGGVITSNDSPFYAVRASTGAPNYYTGWQYTFEVGGGIWGIGMNYVNNEFQFLTNGASTGKFIFGDGNPTTPNGKFLMDLNGGYFGANITSPTATIHAKGIDATSGNYALKVDNSASSPLLYVANSGSIGMNGGIDPLYTLTIGSKATGAIRLYNSSAADMLTVTDASLYNFSAATRIGIGAAASATNTLFIEAFSGLATDYSLNIATAGSLGNLFLVRNDGVSLFNTSTPYATNFGYDVKWQAFANPASSDGNYISLCSGGGTLFNTTFSRRNAGVVKSEMYFIESNDTTYMAIGVIGDANKGFVLRTNDVDRLHISHTGKIGIGQAPTVVKVDILNDSTDPIFRLRSNTFIFDDHMRVDNDGGFRSTSSNAFGTGGIGTMFIDHAYNTLAANGQQYLYYTNSGGANVHGIIGGNAGLADPAYRLKIYQDTTASILQLVSVGTVALNDGFDYTVYNANISSTGIITNAGAGTTYKVGINLDIINGDVNRAINIENGLIRVVKANQPLYATLTSGEFYYDTAANILANGDFVVGMKA